MQTLQQLLEASANKKGKSKYSVELTNNETDGIFFFYFDELNELEILLDHQDSTFNVEALYSDEVEFVHIDLEDVKSIITIIEGDLPEHASLEIYMELVDAEHATWGTVEDFFKRNFVCKFENNEQFGRKIIEHEQITLDALSEQYLDYAQFGKDKLSEYPIMLGLVFKS